MTQFSIVIDNREQAPYSFSSISPMPNIIYGTLTTGDYSIDGHEDKICIERKSAADLFSSTGKGRERFEREFERMRAYQYAALVIETDLKGIVRTPPERSAMLPKAVFRTLISWSVKYDVTIWPCPNRHFAEKCCYLLLKFYWDQYQEKMKDI